MANRRDNVDRRMMNDYSWRAYLNTTPYTRENRMQIQPHIPVIMLNANMRRNNQNDGIHFDAQVMMSMDNGVTVEHNHPMDVEFFGDIQNNVQLNNPLGNGMEQTETIADGNVNYPSVNDAAVDATNMNDAVNNSTDNVSSTVTDDNNNNVNADDNPIDDSQNLTIRIVQFDVYM